MERTPAGCSTPNQARTQSLNQMRSLISTAPESIRDELRHLKADPMLDCASAYRPGTKRHVVSLTEATFAHLCGVSPLDASSGKNERHRLNRGGDRQASPALWRIATTSNGG
jgi:transposase